MKNDYSLMNYQVILTICLLLSVFVLCPKSASGANIFQQAYQVQKNIIQDARNKVEKAVKDTSETAQRVSKAQQATEDAAKEAAEAIVEQKKVAAPEIRTKYLESSLSKTTKDLENANSDIEDMKAKLAESQNAFMRINDQNEVENHGGDLHLST